MQNRPTQTCIGFIFPVVKHLSKWITFSFALGPDGKTIFDIGQIKVQGDARLS